MAIQLVLPDVAEHGGGDVGAGVFGGELLADLAGADGQRLGLQDVQAALGQGFGQPILQWGGSLGEAAAGAGGGGDAALAHEVLPAVPGVQVQQAVHADEQPELGGGEVLAEDLHGIVGVGGALADDVAVAHCKAGVCLGGDFGHGEAVVGGGAGGGFVVGVAGGQEDDAF